MRVFLCGIRRVYHGYVTYEQQCIYDYDATSEAIYGTPGHVILLPVPLARRHPKGTCPLANTREQGAREGCEA